MRILQNDNYCFFEMLMQLTVTVTRQYTHISTRPNKNLKGQNQKHNMLHWRGHYHCCCHCHLTHCDLAKSRLSLSPRFFFVVKIHQKYNTFIIYLLLFISILVIEISLSPEMTTSHIEKILQCENSSRWQLWLLWNAYMVVTVTVTRHFKVRERYLLRIH